MPSVFLLCAVVSVPPDQTLRAAHPHDVHVVARQDQAAGGLHLCRLDRECRGGRSARPAPARPPDRRCSRPTLLRPARSRRCGSLVTLPTTSSIVAKCPSTTRLVRHALHFEHVRRDRRSAGGSTSARPRLRASRRRRAAAVVVAALRCSSSVHQRAAQRRKQDSDDQKSPVRAARCRARNCSCHGSFPHVRNSGPEANTLSRYRPSRPALYARTRITRVSTAVPPAGSLTLPAAPCREGRGSRLRPPGPAASSACASR